MKRLSPKEKNNILSLLRKGKSLNQISKITNRGKPTIYYYYRKIFDKKFKDVQIDYNDKLFLGEFIGLFVGDGYCYQDRRSMHYSTRIFLNYTERNYVYKLKELFNRKFGKAPMMYRTRNVLILNYYSKKLFKFNLDYVGWNISRNSLGFNKKSRTVYLKPRKFSNDFKIGFLRGFIDSDGYISDNKITFDSSSEKIIQQTKRFLLDMGIKNITLSFRKDKRPNRVGMWKIYLKKSEHKKFINLIQPRNLLKLKNASAGI